MRCFVNILFSISLIRFSNFSETSFLRSLTRETFKLNKAVMQLSKILLVAFTLLLLYSDSNAHPTGNMIVVGDYVLWPYLCPVDNPGHQACVMMWSEGNEPKPILWSNHTSSDFMLYQKDEQIYIMERRYNASSQNNEIRILKSSIDETPVEIWAWSEYDVRIGEGGFFMPSDDEMIFVSYPNIYQIEKGGVPKQYFEFTEPVKRIRALDDQRFLLLGDGKAWLTNPKGEIIQQWNNLVADDVNNAPLNRNQVFDIDYQSGELLLAYWGNRSFDTIDSSGDRKTIIQFEEPITPHWLAYFGDKKLLFASHLVMDGSNPKPHLLMQNEESEIIKVWTKQD